MAYFMLSGMINLTSVSRLLILTLCTEAVPWTGLQAAEIQHAVLQLGHQLDLSSPRVASDPFRTVLQYGLSRMPDQRRLSLEQTRAMVAEHLMVTLYCCPSLIKFVCC